MLLPMLLLTGVLAAAALPAQADFAGGFVTRRDGQLVAREWYQFDGRTLRADVQLLTQGLLVETEAVLEDRGVPGGYRTLVRAAMAGPVLTHLEARFSDSVRWSIRGDAQIRDGVSPLRHPLYVIQNSVFAQLALAIQLHGRRLEGGRRLYAWRPEGGAVTTLGVAISEREGTVHLGGVRMDVELDSAGWIRRLSVPSQRLVVEWQERLPLPARSLADPADTTAPPGVSEEPVMFGGRNLSGTLTLPSGQVPVAVIVPPSGEVDRDGNTGPSVRPNTYAQLAWGLARRGVASLRFDHRGGAALTTFDDLAEDVVSAVRALAADPRFTRVVVLGHQEAGWLAVRAAVRGAPVAGIGLLGTPGRSLVAWWRQRLSQSADSLGLAQFDSATARYVRGEPQAGLPLHLERLLRPANHRYLASAAAYDVLSELRRVDAPVLLLHGDRDHRVPVADVEMLGTAAARGEVIVIPGANHLFTDAELALRTGSVAAEMDPRVPIVPALPDRIVEWVRRWGASPGPARRPP